MTLNKPSKYIHKKILDVNLIYTVNPLKFFYRIHRLL